MSALTRSTAGLLLPAIKSAYPYRGSAPVGGERGEGVEIDGEIAVERNSNHCTGASHTITTTLRNKNNNNVNSNDNNNDNNDNNNSYTITAAMTCRRRGRYRQHGRQPAAFERSNTTRRDGSIDKEDDEVGRREISSLIALCSRRQ